MDTELQRRIVASVTRGTDLDVIERTIIDPAPIGADEKAVLWLFAEALEDLPGKTHRIERELIASR